MSLSITTHLQSACRQLCCAVCSTLSQFPSYDDQSRKCLTSSSPVPQGSSIRIRSPFHHHRRRHHHYHCHRHHHHRHHGHSPKTSAAKVVLHDRHMKTASGNRKSTRESPLSL